MRVEIQSITSQEGTKSFRREHIFRLSKESLGKRENFNEELMR